MPINKESLRQKLKTFAIKELFIEELGWDHHRTQPLEIQVDGKTHVLRAIAEKRGMVAYVCHADKTDLPDHSTRLKIERQAERTSHEHIIIFTDESQSTQIWQWVKREPGRPSACRQHQYHKDQPGDALIQKLEVISFGLNEEADLTISHVTARARLAFDLDRVTKRFYESFKSEHTAFLTFIKGLAAQADREWYASLMLNRLMFIYFFQKKGFLDNDTDYLRNRLQQIRKQKGTGKFLSFYTHFLLRLFHEGLGDQDRTSELDTLLGSVPYLDGGLFDIHELERNTKIEITDEAFERLFDFFDKWQWHLDDRPLRADNEINPDVLGYIFEKYINQKQMGAYYTKEDITGYISQNTVLAFLLEKLQTKHPAAFVDFLKLITDDPERYIYPKLTLAVQLTLPADIEAGVTDTTKRAKWNQPSDPAYALPTETWRETISRRNRALELRNLIDSGSVKSVDDLITLNLNTQQFSQDIIQSCTEPAILLDLYAILTNCSVVDPTCGSGAFLFAALNILEPLYDQALDRMQAFLADLAPVDVAQKKVFKEFSQIVAQIQEHPNATYFVLKTIIINNLFGVDIMKEAVEICKLRLFLKLVAQLHTAEEIEPLPDIDFNIRSGNTLIGFTNRQSLEQALQGRIDFESSIDRIVKSAEAAEGAYRLFTRLQGQNLIDAKKMACAKAELRKELEPLEDKLNRFTAEKYKFGLSKDANTYNAWLQTHQPFHWFIEFYGIMKQGGFDIIIGNPPYVEYRKVQPIYSLPANQYESEPAKNLYAFCMERCTKLVNSEGRFGMIVPAGLLGLDDASSLRKVLLKRFKTNWFSTYAIRPSKLFDGVDQRLCIYIASTKGAQTPTINTTRYHHWNAEERSQLFQLLQYRPSFVHATLDRIPQIGSIEAAGVIKKLNVRQSRTISQYYSRTGSLLHYHRSPRYWIRAMDFEQYFKSATRSRSVHHFRDLRFVNEAMAKVAGSIINSSLFFFWFVSVGNGRNITGTDVEQFPLGEVPTQLQARIAPVFDELMFDYKANSFVRKRKDCEFQEFRTSLSKPIIDKIDTLLSELYAFTLEERDFIINYDIKYRLGPDDEPDTDESVED